MAAQYGITGRTSSAIASSVERAVDEARLTVGQQLPSVRVLARQLGVSAGTVAQGYAQLRARGVIATRPGQRSRVSARPPLLTAPDLPLPEGVRDVASGNPDPALLPALGPVLSRLDSTPHLYGQDAVSERLVELAAAQFSADGVSSRDVTVVSGAMDGVSRVLSAHLRPGDPVIVEDPCYSNVLDLLRVLSLEPRPVPVDDAGPLPEHLAGALATNARACLFTPRAQNPVGAAWDATRTRALSSVLDDHPRALVIENDHAAAIAGSAYRTLTAGREHWAVIRSVSKTLGPDLRLGVLAGDEWTVRRVQSRQALTAGWVSHLLQRLVADLWSEPGVELQLERARESYARRRLALVSELADRDVPAHGRTGLNVYIPVAEETPVVSALMQRDWSLRAGEAYRLRSRPFVRATISLVAPAEIETLADAIAAAVRPRRQTLSA